MSKQAPKADLERDPEREALLASMTPGGATILGEDTLPATDPTGATGSPEAAGPAPAATQPESKPAETAADDGEAVMETTEPKTLEEALQPVGKPTQAKAPAPSSEDRLKAEWARLESARAQMLAERAKAEQDRLQQRASGYAPEDYEAVARQFEAEGNDELAAAARNQARQAAQEAHLAKLRVAHNAAIAEGLKKYPDLGKPESGMYKRLDALLKSRPVLFSYPEGIADAIDAAAAYDRADRAAALEQEVSQLKEKLARSEKLLHPSLGGPPVLGSGEVAFDKLSSDKQRALLLRAMRAGGSGG